MQLKPYFFSENVYSYCRYYRAINAIILTKKNEVNKQLQYFLSDAPKNFFVNYDYFQFSPRVGALLQSITICDKNFFHFPRCESQLRKEILSIT